MVRRLRREQKEIVQICRSRFLVPSQSIPSPSSPLSLPGRGGVAGGRCSGRGRRDAGEALLQLLAHAVVVGDGGLDELRGGRGWGGGGGAGEAKGRW